MLIDETSYQSLDLKVIIYSTKPAATMEPLRLREFGTLGHWRL